MTTEEQEDNQIGSFLTKAASDPGTKNQLISAIQSADGQQQNQQTDTNQSNQNQGQDQEDVDPNIQQALQNMNLDETCDCNEQPIFNLLKVSQDQLERDSQLRKKNYHHLGDMIDLDLPDLTKRQALEKLLQNPVNTIKKTIFIWGNPSNWNIKTDANGSSCIFVPSRGTILNFVSEEHARDFVNYAITINQNTRLKERKMKLTSKLKESAFDMNLTKSQFESAIRRHLNEARKNMNRRDFVQYKLRLKEKANKNPRKFVAFIGLKDRKLVENHPGFRRLSKRLTENQKKIKEQSESTENKIKQAIEDLAKEKGDTGIFDVHFSAKQIADKSGVGKSTVSKFLRQIRGSRPETSSGLKITVRKIGGSLGATVNEY